MKFENVKGHAGLVRDKSSGAVLNMNTTEMREARRRKKLWQEQQQKTVTLTSDIDNLKSDVEEIKSLLKQILEVSNGNHNN